MQDIIGAVFRLMGRIITFGGLAFPQFCLSRGTFHVILTLKLLTNLVLAFSNFHVGVKLAKVRLEVIHLIIQVRECLGYPHVIIVHAVSLPFG